jgi:hypothetical protein
MRSFVVLSTSSGVSMANLEALDARIRKLTKLRQLLADEDTVQLLNDPETLAMIRESMEGSAMVTAIHSGTTTNPSNGDFAPSDDLPTPGSFRFKVLYLARACPAQFDARYIVRKLEVEHWEFGTENPMVGVNSALRALVAKDLVRLAREGSGRQPNIYEAVRNETQ